VKVGKLLDKTFYDEYIDPNLFFRNDRLVTDFTEKIRQLPIDQSHTKQKYDDYINESVTVEGMVNSQFNNNLSEPAILPYDPEEERKYLMEKAKKMFQNQQNNSNNMGRLNELLVEDDEDFDFRNTKSSEVREQTYESMPQSNSAPPKVAVQETRQTPIQNTQNQSLDPIISMFRNVKRNTDFSLTFSIKNKIPRLDFIEMMEDSYNTSIIEFLAEEFTNAILLNPQVIKDKISDEIRKLVFSTNESNDTEFEESKPTKKGKKEND
jgi:hypothetical protein